MTQWLLEEACLFALEQAAQPEQVSIEQQIEQLEANANRTLGL